MNLDSETECLKGKMNITLIGMPGVGKSTIGKHLAKTLNFIFFDSDKIIETNSKMTLQEIINSFGEKTLLDLEKKAIIDLGDIQNHVICPGGSVVYSPEAIFFLSSKSKLVFLDAKLESIKSRIPDIAKRGIIGLADKSWEDLYAQRLSLYKKHADIKITLSDNFNIDQIVDEIVKAIFN